MSTANAPKTQLGRFQLVRHLASGGMMELWLAKSPTAKHVAIKRVRMEHARDQRFVQAFVDEVRVATTLRHANIAAVHDVGLENGEYFVAIDWVHGADLRHVLAAAYASEQPLPVEHALTIALATATALQHAHAHGTVHGDVAPANIVVGFDGIAKVIDFGLAKAAHRTRETQPGGVMKGKVAYMAPERCVGQSVDARSDIYSLGIVLYELVTTRRLFKAPNDFLTMTAILYGEIPVPSTVRAGIAPELDAILMTALARDPDHRFQSVEEMRTALEALCTAQQIHTSPAILADHLRAVFGKHAEPWIVDAAPTDFDRTEHGIVPIPEASGMSSLAPPGPMRAVGTPAVGDEPTDIVAPLPLELPEADLSVGDSTMLVRSSPKSVRRRRFGWFAFLALAAIAGVVMFVALRETDDDDPRQHANPNIKLPPPSNPMPVVVPPLAADAAVEETAVADPEPVVAPPPPPVKQDTVHKKKKKKVKRPARRPRKTPAEQPTERAWDRDSLFPK